MLSVNAFLLFFNILLYAKGKCIFLSFLSILLVSTKSLYYKKNLSQLGLTQHGVFDELF